MSDQEWTYKGHKCSIELDYEEDNVKAFHFIMKPDGTRLFADISPYNRGRRTVELWIDAGYPGREINNGGNWRYDTIKEYVNKTLPVVVVMSAEPEREPADMLSFMADQIGLPQFMPISVVTGCGFRCLRMFFFEKQLTN